MLAGMRLAMLLLFSNCAAGAVANAISTTAFATGVGAVRRANGECFTICTPGNACNTQTGLCEPLPCAGKCSFSERCEVLPTGDKCVPAAQP